MTVMTVDHSQTSCCAHGKVSMQLNDFDSGPMNMECGRHTAFDPDINPGGCGVWAAPPAAVVGGALAQLSVFFDKPW